MTSYNMQAAIIILLCGSLTKGHDHFGYTKEEQAKWKLKYKTCGGNLQSPIKIDSSKAHPLPLSDLQLIRYNDPLLLLVVNNGHSASFSTNSRELNNGHVPYIRGGPLKNEYDFQELHFHWGKEDYYGSEHVINGERFALEMHMVHKNRKYRTIKEAKKNTDGLAVLAFFFQISERDNKKLNQLVKHLPKIYEPNGRYTLTKDENFTLVSILPPPEALKDFMTYGGSLTTPPCSEAVTWIVFTSPLRVSDSQMKTFRNLYNHDRSAKMLNNFRFVQDIGTRSVFKRRIPDRRRDSYNRRCSHKRSNLWNLSHK